MDTSARDGGVDDLRTCRRRGACDAVPGDGDDAPAAPAALHNNPFEFCRMQRPWAYHSHYIIQAQVMYDAV